MRLQLCLLQAENVRGKQGKGLWEAFIQTGSQTIDIPGYQFHNRSPFINVAFHSESEYSIKEDRLK